MVNQKKGRQSFVFEHHPVITAWASVAGKKESEGPLAHEFDVTSTDTLFAQKTWEQAEKQKNAEIHALQMQINPHYIYNTLASIKWLVYQNDRDRTVQTIDAFISLLRNTISNTDEFITIDQEVQNLENYILINHTRYGDAVQVEFYVSQNCRDWCSRTNCRPPYRATGIFCREITASGFSAARILGRSRCSNASR